MAQFRKKPVVIEAVQFLGAGNEIGEDEPAWYREARTKERDERGAVWFNVDGKGPHLTIFTLEGDHRADAGDWIIRGVKGELYPIKADVFALTYEAVE